MTYVRYIFLPPPHPPEPDILLGYLGVAVATSSEVRL